jgi:hypothetical protein
MLSRRQVAFVISVAVAVVGASAIWFGAAAVVLAIFGRDAQAAAPWLALAKAASLAWVGAVGWLISWRRLDEMERETRKFSWLIGSTAAILLTAPIMLFWLVNGGAFLAQFLGRRGTPGAFFALGWVGLVLAQLIGSLLARAGWWATKR